MEDRVHAFEGIRGYDGAGGRAIHTGRLFRSAQFGEATDADIDRLHDLEIRLQADLRRPDERERHGHRWPDKRVTVLSSEKGRAQEATHVR